jgi:hypothetical protein
MQSSRYHKLKSSRLCLTPAKFAERLKVRDAVFARAVTARRNPMVNLATLRAQGAGDAEACYGLITPSVN